jgi:DNA polymerase-3 subunit epsilon
MDFGLILDVETTGIDPEKDKIIEIGVLEFGVREDGRPFITTMYGGVEDPGIPIPQEIQKLTGLTDDMVRGQAIDWNRVAELLRKSSLVVAHNASFDRAFVERRPELAGIKNHWACSLKHIDWEAKGFRTKALNYLAADHGFVNPFAHRALFDCATTFRIIESYFPELLNRSYLRQVRVSAFGAAFETKDILRNARYRWNAELRVWFKEVLEDGLEGERLFLRAEVYKSDRQSHKEEFLSD